MPSIPKLEFKGEPIFVDKVFPSGALSLSTIKDGVWKTHLYMGYPKKDAVRMFKRSLK